MNHIKTLPKSGQRKTDTNAKRSSCECTRISITSLGTQLLSRSSVVTLFLKLFSCGVASGAAFSLGTIVPVTPSRHLYFCSTHVHVSKIGRVMWTPDLLSVIDCTALLVHTKSFWRRPGSQYVCATYQRTVRSAVEGFSGRSP